MGSITSSGKPPGSKGDSPSGAWYAPGVRAGLEGGAAALSAAVALRWGLERQERASAVIGLALAWATCTVGALALAYGLRHARRWFWWTFGFGVFLRIAVLAALMAVAWTRPLGEAGALLGAYVLGLAGMMLVEFRHLIRRNL